MLYLREKGRHKRDGENVLLGKKLNFFTPLALIFGSFSFLKSPAPNQDGMRISTFVGFKPLINIRVMQIRNYDIMHFMHIGKYLSVVCSILFPPP